MIAFRDNMYKTLDQNLYYGTHKIGKVYKGSTLVYPEPSSSGGYYEDIVIPAGNRILTYTNKYDPSQTFTVYQFEPITLETSVLVPTTTYGTVSTGISDSLMNGGITRSTESYRDYESLISSSARDLFYMAGREFEQIIPSDSSSDVNVYRDLYSYIDQAKLQAAYRTSTDTQSHNGIVTDLFTNVGYYIVGDSRTKRYCDIRLSSLVSMDFDGDQLSSLIVNSYPASYGYQVDRSIPFTYKCYSDSCIVTIDNSDYVFVQHGSTDGFRDEFDKLITTEGEVRYIPSYNYNYLFKESPTSEDPYINIDIDIYFNWTWDTSTLSQPITIRTWIPEYDEHGKPIEN
jgi:hypothetical protein